MSSCGGKGEKNVCILYIFINILNNKMASTNKI